MDYALLHFQFFIHDDLVDTNDNGVVKTEGGEDISSYLRDCDEVLKDLQEQLWTINDITKDEELLPLSSATGDQKNLIKIGDRLIRLGDEQDFEEESSLFEFDRDLCQYDRPGFIWDDYFDLYL